MFKDFRKNEGYININRNVVCHLFVVGSPDSQGDSSSVKVINFIILKRQMFQTMCYNIYCVSRYTRMIYWVSQTDVLEYICRRSL